jgi:hypothetical protein
MNIESKITSEIYNWLSNNFESKIPQNIIAINFGIQIIENGFEVYFFGSDFYDENDDIWLQNESYTPLSNYLFIENKNNQYSENEIYKLYKSEIFHFIKNNKSKYPKNVLNTTVTYFAGNPEVIFKQRHVLTDIRKGGFSMLLLILFMIIFIIIASVISLIILWFTWD